jgi:hypothetical protein
MPVMKSLDDKDVKKSAKLYEPDEDDDDDDDEDDEAMVGDGVDAGAAVAEDASADQKLAYATGSAMAPSATIIGSTMIPIPPLKIGPPGFTVLG